MSQLTSGEGIGLGESIYIPQCAVCTYVDGYGCKAFAVKMRESKYRDEDDPDFSKCPKYKPNPNAYEYDVFLRLSKNYKWKR